MEYYIKNINEINELIFDSNEMNRIIYKSEHFEYNVLVCNKEKFDRIAILSNGAVNPEKESSPVFMRSSWSKDIDSSLIFLDDSTIHNTKLSLGWGQGNSKEFVLSIYSQIIKEIVKNLSIEDEKVCYFGSSAGGFMSMLLSSMHINSFAVVNNPQTDITKYHDGHSKPLLELSYGSVENAYTNYGERISVIDAFKYYGNTPKVYYIQNQISNHDLKFHVNPFIKLMKDDELGIEKIIFINYFDKEKGHNPLDKKSALKSLNFLLKSDIF